MWMPRSAPFARASLMVCFTRSGPIETATTSPPCFSFSRSASSRAKLSGSFISKPMSDSLIQSPEMASGASFAGTCLTHTMIFTGVFLQPCTAPASNRGKAGSRSGSARQSSLLPGPALENQRRVRSPEAERVRKGVVHAGLASHIGHVIQIARRIGTKLVDGGRQSLVAQRKHTDSRFEAARPAEQVSGHGFGRADRQLLGDRSLPEQALHCRGFDDVADRRGRAVRIHVADVVGR